jgi:hypothetical protein
MSKDFTWETSARAYLEVYLKVLGRDKKQIESEEAAALLP